MIGVCWLKFMVKFDPGKEIVVLSRVCGITSACGRAFPGVDLCVWFTFIEKRKRNW